MFLCGKTFEIVTLAVMALLLICLAKSIDRRLRTMFAERRPFLNIIHINRNCNNNSNNDNNNN